MLLVTIISAIAVLFIINIKWTKNALAALSFTDSCNRLIAEPDEELVLTTEIANHRRFFNSFVRTVDYLPIAACLSEKSESLKAYRYTLSGSQFINRSFFLGARRLKRQTIGFTIGKRGKYDLGRHDICAGDLFGLSERKKPVVSNTCVVIMPERSRNVGNLNALGSFLGDISVQRFIIEDPMMTIGFDDYTGQEPMKYISWTRTAASNRLQVRRLDHTVDRTVMVLMNMEHGTPETFENVFSTVRVVCEQLESKKIPYSLMTNGRFEGTYFNYGFLPEGLGETHLNTVLYGLGSADYTCYYSLDTMVGKVMERRDRRESYILVSSKLDGSGEAALAKLMREGRDRVCFLECGKEADV